MTDLDLTWPGPEATPDTPQGRRIGYARVSTEDQRLDLQLDALARVGCDRVFQHHGVSGAKAERPGLDAALSELIAGDVLVVYKLDRLGRSVLHLTDLFTRMDNEGVHFCSLTEGINTTTAGGRLVFHVFAAMAEFMRDMIRENTINGLAAAKVRGVRIGRPCLMDDAMIIEAHRYMRQENRTLDQVAARYGISKSTLMRSFDRLGIGTTL
ncbi:MAG: recombinase family protein [Pseudomonadota bacterium]